MILSLNPTSSLHLLESRPDLPPRISLLLKARGSRREGPKGRASIEALRNIFHRRLGPQMRPLTRKEAALSLHEIPSRISTAPNDPGPVQLEDVVPLHGRVEQDDPSFALLPPR
jgi:hypothetical protein